MRKEIELGKNVDEIINFAVNAPDIPHLYANGFINAMGNGDTVLILQQNGKPIATLNLSFTLTKTLAQKLEQIIGDLEKDTKNIIMTTDDISGALAKREKKKRKKRNKK